MNLSPRFIGAAARLQNVLPEPLGRARSGGSSALQFGLVTLTGIAIVGLVAGYTMLRPPPSASDNGANGQALSTDTEKYRYTPAQREKLSREGALTGLIPAQPKTDQ